MSYKENIYKNALSTIEYLYKESQYNKDVDFYRIYDIINSLNDSQFKSKEWLVEKLLEYIDKDETYSIIIAGSWYGLIGIILREHLSKDVHITNVDYDKMSKIIGMALVGNDSLYERNHYKEGDAIEYYLDNPKNYDLIINTSCEHMEKEDIRFMVEAKKHDTLVCLQANNYDTVQSHINTYSSLEEFVNEINLVTVLYAGKTEIGDGFERYMVIGK